jgi:hypothetical protein
MKFYRNIKRGVINVTTCGLGFNSQQGWWNILFISKYSSEVLKALTMGSNFFWVVPPCSSVGLKDVSEELTASIKPSIINTTGANTSFFFSFL